MSDSQSADSIPNLVSEFVPVLALNVPHRNLSEWCGFNPAALAHSQPGRAATAIQGIIMVSMLTYLPFLAHQPIHSLVFSHSAIASCSAALCLQTDRTECLSMTVRVLNRCHMCFRS